MKKLLIMIVTIPLFLAGCSNHAQTSASKTSPTYGVPSQVTWNGNAYTTQLNPITVVGKQLGVIKIQGLSGAFKVFSVPGEKTDYEVAVELDIPNVGKYFPAFHAPN